MKRFVSIGIVLFTCILASAAHALLMGLPIPDPSPRNCVQETGLTEADQPLFIAVVSGFFHNAPCKPGEPRVAVFRYTTNPDSSVALVLDFTIDRVPKTVTGMTIYELVGRVAEVLLNNPPESVVQAPTSSAQPQAEKAFGYIYVNSRPWSRVLIDGKEDIGLVTPLAKHRLTVGRHTVRLVNSKMRCENTYDVNVQPNQTTSLIKQLECTE